MAPFGRSRSADGGEKRVPRKDRRGMSPLVVGVPSEIKDNEKRVALTPDGVVELRDGAVIQPELLSIDSVLKSSPL